MKFWISNNGILQTLTVNDIEAYGLDHLWDSVCERLHSKKISKAVTHSLVFHGPTDDVS